MLLAAGRGNRMEPLSSLIPKPALEVLGRPLLAWGYDHLRAAGCHPIVVNLHRHAETVAAAARAAAGQAPLVFSPEPELLGSAGGIAAARCYFEPGPVLVANADVWGALDLAPLLGLGAPARAVLGLLPHPDPARWSVIEMTGDGRVGRILPPGGTTVGPPFLFTGLQLLGEEVVRALPPSPAEFAPVWQALAQRGELYGAVLSGQWQEAGTPATYHQLITGLLAGGVWQHFTASVAAAAKVTNSAVGEGCAVEGGAAVIDSVLTGGARVAAGAEVEGCVVAGAVTVPTGARLRHLLALPTGQFPLR